MADQGSKKEEAQAVETESSKKKSGLMPLLIIIGVVALEGITVGVMMMLGGGPTSVQGVQLQTEQNAELNKPAEIMLVKDRFPNMRTGRNYLYDMEVYITTSSANKDKVAANLESMKAQMSMAVATIIRQAEPEWFQEATLATLRRKIKAVLDEKLGMDDKDKSYVQKVLITKCIQLRMNI